MSDPSPGGIFIHHMEPALRCGTNDEVGFTLISDLHIGAPNVDLTLLEDELKTARDNWLAGEHGRSWGYAESWAKLWAAALAENERQDFIAHLAQRTHEAAHEESLPRVRQTKPTISPDEWQAGRGDSNYASRTYGNNGTLVRRKGERLETSRGAQVPWKHAIIAFRKAMHCRAANSEWQRNGEKLPVGTFQVNRIAADGTLIAGCHVIAWDEMLRLAVREIPQEVKPVYQLPAVVQVAA